MDKFRANLEMCVRDGRGLMSWLSHFDFKVLIDAPCVMIEPAIGPDKLGRDWPRGARGVGK